MTPARRTWHLITGEYPPDPGGVADYTALVAAGLADAGCDVHVWAQGVADPEHPRPGVTVHRVAGRYGPVGLARLGRELDRFPGPRDLLVQYTAQNFGFKAMNVAVHLWLLARRVTRGDVIRVVFHEVAVGFGRRPLRRNVVAAVNRVMAALVLAAARTAFVTIPGWEPLVRRLGGRRLPVRWVPVPAAVPADPPPGAVAAARSRVAGAARVVGHFGTYGPLVTAPLAPALRHLLADPGVRVLLLGRGGVAFRDNLVRDRPDWAGRVTATGGLPAEEVAAHLQTCDVVLQPFPDGVSTRRTTVMAALANGVPVVTTFGILSEPVWKDDPAVVLADPADLAGAAERLLADPPRLAALGRAGRDLYDRRFALRHTVAALSAPPSARTTPVTPPTHPPKVLFFVEGFTDIRFVVGLSRICDLTLAVPARTYGPSGLKARVAESGARVVVHEIPGGRAGFQVRSLGWLLRHAGGFDVVLAQEVLRGALNANLAGLAAGVPVVTYMGIAPAEYFRCRYERGQIGWAKWRFGDAVIRTLMAVNGRLAARCLAMGPYLRDIARKYCPRSEVGLYYGVDTDVFRPADAAERAALRAKRGLPADRFLVFFSSRISHEKDAETVLRAVASARRQGLDAVVLNLGGGYQDFLNLARELALPDPAGWVIGGPALHPMTEVADVFRAADVMALASLAEGAAYSTLEALSCGTPVVATGVGGMAVQLAGWARLTPRQDPQAMARELLWVAANPDAARVQARQAREEYIVPEWNRAKAFADLRAVFDALTRPAGA